MYFKQEFEEAIKHFEDKQSETLRLPILIRLIDKLADKKIEDERVESRIAELLTQLQKVNEDYRSNKKLFIKDLKELADYLRKEHGLYAKGFLKSTYMSYGISIGTALGVVFMNSIGPSYLAIGIGVGIAIGIAIGSQKEKQKEQEDLLY